MGVYDTSIGTLLVGIIFNTYLYGLVTFQFAVYQNRKKKLNDRMIVRYLVLSLFIIDTVHSAAVIYMAYVYCVTNYNNPAILAYALWPYTLTPIATASAALLTQLFLGHRIYALGGSRILYGVIILLAIPSFALGVTCGVRAWIIKVLVRLPVLSHLVTAWLAMQVGIDLLITVTLSRILIKAKTGFRRTDSVLNRLIRGAIQTGLFAGIFSLGDLITFIVWPDTNFYGMFAIPIGRIYTNTLLDTLNAREELRERMAGTLEFDGRIDNTMRWATLPATSTQTDSVNLTQLCSSTQNDSSEQEKGDDCKPQVM